MMRYIPILICLAVLGVFLHSATADAQNTMSVKVRESQLRATPSPLGKILVKVSYGDQVTVLEKLGAWEKVATAGGKVKGWIHSTALTSQKIALKSGQADVKSSVGQKEIALAGKGFSKEVEAEYGKANKNIDYTWINRMETYAASSSQMQKFIADGRLAIRTEGGKP